MSLSIFQVIRQHFYNTEIILREFVYRLNDFFFAIMVNCCVLGCTIFLAKTIAAGISHHKIVTDKSFRKAWIGRLWLDNLPPLKCCCVCCKHFTEDCFLDDLKSELIPAQITNMGLKRDAACLFHHSIAQNVSNKWTLRIYSISSECSSGLSSTQKPSYVLSCNKPFININRQERTSAVVWSSDEKSMNSNISVRSRQPSSTNRCYGTYMYMLFSK